MTMNIAVTGPTGSLGQEVCRALWRNGHGVVPLVRAPDRQIALQRLQDTFAQEATFISDCVAVDLLEPSAVRVELKSIDAIVHAAGNTQFSSEGLNARMATTAVRFAERHQVPLYHVSSAFVLDGVKPRSSYEADKAAAEKTVADAKVPWAIFRPGILTGDSTNGHIANPTGYYVLLKALIRFSHLNHRGIRFPQFAGTANIIPVDSAAMAIADAVQRCERGVLYVTNPAPPAVDWLFTESLRLLNASDQVSFLPCALTEFRKLQLEPAEINLLNFVSPFLPYWLDIQALPSPTLPCLEDVRTDEPYVRRIIAYAQSRQWL